MTGRSVTGAGRRVRLVAAVIGALTAGALAAGCGAGGAAAPSHAPSPAPVIRTVSTVPTPTSAPPSAKKAGAPTLAECGSLRDPFDPSATPPPAGSPARC